MLQQIGTNNEEEFEGQRQRLCFCGRIVLYTLCAKESKAPHNAKDLVFPAPLTNGSPGGSRQCRARHAGIREHPATKEHTEESITNERRIYMAGSGNARHPCGRPAYNSAEQIIELMEQGSNQRGEVLWRFRAVVFNSVYLFQIYFTGVLLREA